MNRRLLFVLSVIVLLSSLGIRTVFADCKTPCSVSYTASGSVSRSRLLYSFDVTVTVEGVTNYTCSVEGDIPPTATCHWNVAPNGGELTVDYHIERPIGGDIDGSKTIPFPYEGEELLNDLPIEIPIDSIATITITIHGHLIGDLTPSTGSVNPTQLEWSTWGTQDTVLSANDDTVDLLMETAYSVYFTICVSVGDFEIGCGDSSIAEVAGIPTTDCVIPEFPSFLLLPLFMITTLLAAIVYRKKTDKSQKLKSPHRN